MENLNGKAAGPVGGGETNMRVANTAENLDARAIMEIIDADGPDVPPLPPTLTSMDDVASIDAIPDGDDPVFVPEAEGSAMETGSLCATGFNVDEMNREYTLILAGAKAIVVKETADGHLQFLSPEAFLTW